MIEQVDWVNPTMHKLYAPDKRWRLIVERYLETGTGSASLYERESDLLEIKNLADSHLRAVASLMHAMRALSDEITDFSFMPSGVDMVRISRVLKNVNHLIPNKFGSQTDKMS